MTSAMTTANVGSARSGARLATHKRRNNRIAVPTIGIVFEERVHHSVDWSLGGFLVEPYGGGLLPGDEFLVTGIGPPDDTINRVSIVARVVRVRSGRLAAEFAGLDAQAFDLLEALMMRRHRYLTERVAA